MTENCVPTLIVAKAGLLQNGLLALMATIPQVNVLGEADSAPAALEMMREYRPRLVLLNTDLPGEEEWDVLRHIRARWPNMGCIVLADDAQQQKEAQAAGADVVLLKGIPPAQIIAAVEGLASRRKTGGGV